MASLVSPGVSVTVTDDSFYVPASAPTVPLFFIATRSGKFQPDGITAAAGTNEHGVVRTITSLGQSVQLYGVPYFKKDNNGNEFHGDALNEYGLFALNQYLGVGNRAYVVRANVDSANASTAFVGIGTAVIVTDVVQTGVGEVEFIDDGVTSEFVKPQDILIAFTSLTEFEVTGSLDGLIGAGEVGTPFTSSIVNFTINEGLTASAIGDTIEYSIGWIPTSATVGGYGEVGTLEGLRPDPLVLGNTAGASELWTITFSNATTFSVVGSLNPGSPTTGTVGVPFDNGKINFTFVNSIDGPPDTGDAYTVQFANRIVVNPLGANDATRRTSIVTALQAVINSNTEIRSTDLYEYNIIVAPGYPEVVDELMALQTDILEEAFVIADTPVGLSPEAVADWALTGSRVSGTGNAYYYPWGLASNLDGRNVVCAPSGIALRTFTYSDNESYVWFAPAGARRGLVTGISTVGYVTGTLGTATTYVEVNLNNGQRDNLYEASKNINPIAYFAGRGLLVFGQKTSAVAASSLDRVNVSRLTMYLRRALRKASVPFLFQPNDKITRDDFKSALDGIFNDVMSKRGIADFATRCDEENNTPFRIDNNEMYADAAFIATKSTEFIYIPMRLLSTGASL